MSVRDEPIVRVLVVRENGDPDERWVFRTVVATWFVGDFVVFGPDQTLRITAIETQLARDLLEQEIRAVFTVVTV